jgi:hypothetical protein
LEFRSLDLGKRERKEEEQRSGGERGEIQGKLEQSQREVRGNVGGKLWKFVGKSWRELPYM